MPMTLLRLQGCPVGCPFCDTKYTWETSLSEKVLTLDAALGATPKWVELNAQEISERIAKDFSGPRWVLVTGGEPAEQDLKELVAALHTASVGRLVALETSGTALGFVDAGFDWVCISPKINMPGGKKVLAEAVYWADEIKYVIGRQKDLDELDQFLKTYGRRKSWAEICLQPMSLSKKATELCIKTCMERGWRLSVQTHRLLDLP